MELMKQEEENKYKRLIEINIYLKQVLEQKDKHYLELL